MRNTAIALVLLPVSIALTGCGQGNTPSSAPMATRAIQATRLDRASNRYVYIWRARKSVTADDERILRALLHLVGTVDYTVQRMETTDLIIHRRFLLGHRRQERAFQIYEARLKELNPQLGWRPAAGTILKLPAGPTYAATRLDKKRLGDIFIAAFHRMLSRAHNTTWKSSHLPRLTTDEQMFLYPDASSYSSGGWRMVQDEGIVAATPYIDLPDESFSRMQPLELTVSSENRVFFDDLIQVERDGRLLPADLQANENTDVACNSACTPAASALRIRPSSFPKSRLLIVDSGIIPGVLVDSHVLYPPGGASLGDQSSVHHGTFIFKELSSPPIGVLTEKELFVGNAMPAATKGAYQMTEVLHAMNVFLENVKGDPNAATTSVVNLSMFGEPPSDAMGWKLPVDSRLLMIAAAGNAATGLKGSISLPAHTAFPRLTGGEANLLSVAALAQDGSTRAAYSHYNQRYVQLMAQGDCICGAQGSNVLKQLNGTSMAAPLVAAAAAILANAKPEWNASDVMWRLLSTADRGSADTSPGNPVPDFTKEVLAGRLNLGRALQTDKIEIRKTAQPGTSVYADWVQFNGPWGDQMTDNEACTSTVTPTILRVTDGHDEGGKRFFSLLVAPTFQAQPVPVDPGWTMTFQESGKSKQTLPAREITDVILPMRQVRNGCFPDPIGFGRPFKCATNNVPCP